MRLYRDPVHGDILLAPLAADLLDTPEMQRLGRIMQLTLELKINGLEGLIPG